MRWISLLLLGLMAPLAHAAQPVDGGINFQPAATEIAERVHFFDNVLLFIITIITLFVVALLAIVILRYNSKANPEPSKFSHNTLIEIVWTVVPVLILLFISFFSFRELYYQDVAPDIPEDQIVNIKAQGNQWNWTYYYQDEVDEEGYPLIEFVSNPLHVGLSTDPVATAADPRNLAVDYPMVVPVDTVVRVYTAASDVIHSWTVPAFGVKTDAIPGRLNQLWFRVKEPGTYYGQCSELCGVNHAYMPIEVRVLPKDQYAIWAENAKNDLDTANQYLASLETDASTQLAALN